MRVLIVDDFPPKLDLLVALTRRLRPDAEIVIAQGFVEGRGAIVANDFDIALFDNRLHDGSGMELYRLARKQQIPVALVVSAHEPATEEEQRTIVDVRKASEAISGAFVAVELCGV